MRRSSTAVSSSLVIFPFVKLHEASFNSAMGVGKNLRYQNGMVLIVWTLYNPPLY